MVNQFAVILWVQVITAFAFTVLPTFFVFLLMVCQEDSGSYGPFASSLPAYPPLSKSMSATRESSTENYPFGYTTELSSNHESSLCTAKRLRQRLQRQQSGQSGRRYTGESSESSSLVGTPVDSGRCFTFTAAQRILRNEERKPSVNQNFSEMLLDAIHLDDCSLVDRLLLTHNSKVLSTSPSIGSTNTFTDLAQRRHGNQNHRRSNASSTVSTHSGGRSTCAALNTLHIAIVHKKREIVELLLKNGYDPNQVAACCCKGNCTASGNIPLSSVLPRTHASAPEMCSTCSQLRVVSIIDQTPLAVAVRAQSPEMIAMLVAFGADLNGVDEDGNSPLLLAVRESPLSWNCLHTLIFFGARILQKNTRGICPLDLAPELSKLQQSCVESLFQTACSPPEDAISQPSIHHDRTNRSSVVHGGSIPGGSLASKPPSRKLHVDSAAGGSYVERMSLNKAPLSPRNSTAPSISASSMLETSSSKESNRRKSFVSLQLHRRSKIPKEFFENITWDQAWEMLQKMAANPECVELILAGLRKFCMNMDDRNHGERDALDSHVGGLLHQLLLTSIGEFQLATPTYQRANRRQLIGVLVQLVNFCYSCLQRSGSCRQFAALSTLNKIIDASLVYSLFPSPDVVFHSSRLLNRPPYATGGAFQSCDLDEEEALAATAGGHPSFVPLRMSMDDPNGSRRQTLENTVTHESRSGTISIRTRTGTMIGVSHAPQPQQSFYRRYIASAAHSSNPPTAAAAGAASKPPPIVRPYDLLGAFSSLEPPTLLAALHNAITMLNRDGGGGLRSIVCSPAHRWRYCPDHCGTLLIARLLLFLCSTSKIFRRRLSERAQLKTLVQMLEPTFDPQLLCLLLQLLAIIALEPATHPVLLELQVDDALIQMLLPADDWYYTNHSTKFGHYVKHNAARVLIYLGQGDRVGNRVNIFQSFGIILAILSVHYESIEDTPHSQDSRRQHSTSHLNSKDEDVYIDCICRSPHTINDLHRTSMSVEGILEKMLQELSASALNTTEAITEESPSASSPPAIKSVIGENSVQATLVEEEGEFSMITITPSSRRPSCSGSPMPAPTPTNSAQSVGSNPSPSSVGTPPVQPASGPPPSPLANPQQQHTVVHATSSSASTAAVVSTSAQVHSHPLATHSISSASGLMAALSNSPAARVLLSLNNLEQHLCKFSMIFDSTLILRVLLHKLSWDLSLVAKRRATAAAAASSAMIPDRMGGPHSSNSDAVRAHSSCSLGSPFNRRDDPARRSETKRFLRVDQGSRLSKRVHIRRSSSVEIPRPKRFSSGAKELRKERRRRLGTDTSSGSSRSKKTTSSSSSVQKHLPKYIQSLFRNRMGTDPCKRQCRESSPDNDSSGSEAVLEFTKKLQNIPPSRRETMRQAYHQSGHQDSGGSEHRRQLAASVVAGTIPYAHLPELEVNGASPPRSPMPGGDPAAAGGSSSLQQPGATANRRPSSPQAIPGLPLIEIRRPSALSQFEFGYFVNSPELVGNAQDSDCAPLLLMSGCGPQISSRKSSDESSICGGWSSRASSVMSQRSSSGGLRLSTFSAGTSIASDNSGPFLFSFVLRKRASTIGTRIPLPKRAISRSSGDSLRVPDRESPLQLIGGIEMSPDFQCIRQLLLNLLVCGPTGRKSPSFVATLRSCVDVLRQVLNSPQHPTVKNWCADILAIVNSQLETEEECKMENDERTNDEYLDLQDQIISGSLPCPKEEAAFFAAIQLTVEENWPANRRTQTIRRHLLKGQFGRIRDLAQKIMVTPWEVDQNLYCTPPRAFSESAGRKQSVNFHPQPDQRRRSLTLFGCMSDPDPGVSSDLQAQCLPMDLRGDRRTIKMIRERKRKLFHSQIYESESAMKKLYIQASTQTAKKLPAFGCKVFQVKELLHGRTLRKMTFFLLSSLLVHNPICARLQTVRLLCLSSAVLCLLDGGTKVILKRQHAGTLQQWRVGGGVSKHQLLLEFRGTKWQLIAPSYTTLKSISMSLWEIMQTRASVLVQRSFNRSSKPSLTLFDSRTGQSSRTNSYSSSCSSTFRPSVIMEPITLFRLELERLQYILVRFPEEVAFQLSSTEYQLFYNVAPIDYIRYVGCDLASIPIVDNPSPVKNLIKRLSEVSSWITHVVISQPTHDERKHCLSAIIRVIETLWNVGNFNAAVEIMMGLKSSKLRPFWLSLKNEERQRYEEFVDILLPNNDGPPHLAYVDAIQRALRMPQCRVVPFFGTFLRDLYAIVNDLPNLVIVGQENEVEKMKFLTDINGDDHFSSSIGVGGLLNADKINLVAVVMENLEVFHRHSRQVGRYLSFGDPNQNAAAVGATNAEPAPSGSAAHPAGQEADSERPEPKVYEPVQHVPGSAHGISLIPLNSATFDLDVIQRIQHGTTVIHYDPDTNRSVLCRLMLDASCSTVTWHRINYGGGRDRNEKEGGSSARSAPQTNLETSRAAYLIQRPAGSASISMDEGFIRTSYIKAVESVDSYDIDIESIYRRHSAEEMSVPVFCWTINFGCILNDNEFLYFLAPQQIANYWMNGLQRVVHSIQEGNQNPDQRVVWLKKMYLGLYNQSDAQCYSDVKRFGPRPVEALQAFGGRVEKWRNLGMNQNLTTCSRPTDSSSSTDGSGAKSRLKQMTIAVTRRVKGASRASRDCSRSQSPQPQSPLVRPPSIKSQLSSQSGPTPNSPGYLLKVKDTTALSDAGDLDSLYTPRSRTPTSSSYGGRSVGGRSIKSWRSRGGETPNSGSISSSGQVSAHHGLSGREYQEKPVQFPEFLELFRLFSTRMRKDLKDLFNECVLHSGTANSHVPKKEKQSPRLQSRLDTMSNNPLPDFIPDDVLTRNSVPNLFHMNEKQFKIYNALALASVNSAGLMDTSRNAILTPSALKQFICTQQMENVDEAYVLRLIQEHEPDPLYRAKQLMTFEGFVRFLSDPTNFAFVPEKIEVPPEQLQYPLSAYFISSSHNTSSLPVILSIENHCSLQQQAKMAQMFRTVFGDKLVTNFLFDCDYSDSPRLPSPWQLRHKILIKNKKMTMEPSIGLSFNDPTALTSVAASAALMIHGGTSNLGTGSTTHLSGGSGGTSGVAITRHKPSRCSYDSSTIDDVDEDDLLDDELFDQDSDDESVNQQKTTPTTKSRRSTPRRSSSANSFVSDRTNATARRHKHVSDDTALSDCKTEEDVLFASGNLSTGRRVGRLPTGHQIAPELSDLVIYTQAVKFKAHLKGFVANVDLSPLLGFGYDDMREDLLTAAVAERTSSFTTTLGGGSTSVAGGSAVGTPRGARAAIPTLLGTPRRQKSSGQISMESGKSNGAMPAADEITVATPTTASARPNATASCYQVTSLPEASARKLCRKQPFKIVAYTRNHIMRSYPGVTRMDSSNFNPLQFWQFGLQMVALNYQTPDVPMAINAAMFEQSGNCGYTLKPRAMWDPAHPLYGKFNPLSKDLLHCSALILQLTVISGQYVCPTQFNASPFLEIEILGVPADCCKEKSKIVGRNAVNPVWNHSCTFRITFADLAFLRIAVCDGAANGRCISQRVVPVKCLRPGYRHLPLRTAANQPLEAATLFLRTRFEQEEHIYLHDDDINSYSNYEPELAYQILSVDPDANIKPLSILRRQIFIIRIVGLFADDTPSIVHAESGTTVRGVILAALANAGKVNESADDYILFEESAAPLESAPSPVGDLSFNMSVPSTSTNLTSGFPSLADQAPIQRMLPHNEPIMDAVACWDGSTRRFHLRKKTADASERAWITSIIKSSGSNTMSSSPNGGSILGTAATSPAFGLNRKTTTPAMAGGLEPSSGNVSPRGISSQGSQKSMKSHSSSQIHGRSLDVDQPSCDFLEPRGLHPRARSMGDTFLVCVHNVSEHHPYAILRTSIYNTSRDVIKQIFVKTQRYDADENDFVLVEELRDNAPLETSKSAASTSKHIAGTAPADPKSRPFYRMLNADENVWKTQSRWTGAGRFLLERRESALQYERLNYKAGDPPAGSSHRKISLSNMRSINLPRRISRFGKSLTMDRGADKDPDRPPQ
ncbi:hypothetical protein M3Y99_01077200 [Aphelenchoides fujianensis]|nr:hypothetical protein M3Y99_01077200 [Aphelenchoides fujianensis]